MADTKTMLERFEHWVAEHAELPLDRERGSYVNGDTAFAWGMWCGADEAARVAYGVDLITVDTARMGNEALANVIERVPCSRCTSEIYCEMNGCKRRASAGNAGEAEARSCNTEG